RRRAGQPDHPRAGRRGADDARDAASQHRAGGADAAGGSLPLNLGRLRQGELIAGVSGVLLLVFMFALKWYALKGVLVPEKSILGGPTSYNGWHGLTHL